VAHLVGPTQVSRVSSDTSLSIGCSITPVALLVGSAWVSKVVVPILELRNGVLLIYWVTWGYTCEGGCWPRLECPLLSQLITYLLAVYQLSVSCLWSTSLQALIRIQLSKRLKHVFYQGSWSVMTNPLLWEKRESEHWDRNCSMSNPFFKYYNITITFNASEMYLWKLSHLTAHR